MVTVMERGETGSWQWYCWSSGAVGRFLRGIEKRMDYEKLAIEKLAALPGIQAMSSLLSSTLATLSHSHTIHAVWTRNK